MSGFDELVGLFLTEDMREFKGASELDDSLIKSIRKEYFKKTFVLPIICIFISLAIVALWLFDVIQPQLLTGIVSEDIFSIALMLLVAFSGLAAGVSTVRCIFSLIIVSKIKKKNFSWYRGFIRGRVSRYPAKISRMQYYYSVDDKYFALVSANPKYKKKTPIYFLYFPGLSDHSAIGGAVVSYEAAARVEHE